MKNKKQSSIHKIYRLTSPNGNENRERLHNKINFDSQFFSNRKDIKKHGSNNQFKVKLPKFELTSPKKNRKDFNILNIMQYKGRSLFDNNFSEPPFETINYKDFDKKNSPFPQTQKNKKKENESKINKNDLSQSDYIHILSTEKTLTKTEGNQKLTELNDFEGTKKDNNEKLNILKSQKKNKKKKYEIKSNITNKNSNLINIENQERNLLKNFSAKKSNDFIYDISDYFNTNSNIN